MTVAETYPFSTTMPNFKTFPPNLRPVAGVQRTPLLVHKSTSSDYYIDNHYQIVSVPDESLINNQVLVDDYSETPNSGPRNFGPK